MKTSTFISTIIFGFVMLIAIDLKAQQSEVSLDTEQHKLFNNHQIKGKAYSLLFLAQTYDTDSLYTRDPIILSRLNEQIEFNNIDLEQSVHFSTFCYELTNTVCHELYSSHKGKTINKYYIGYNRDTKRCFFLTNNIVYDLDYSWVDTLKKYMKPVKHYTRSFQNIVEARKFLSNLKVNENLVHYDAVDWENMDGSYTIYYKSPLGSECKEKSWSIDCLKAKMEEVYPNRHFSLWLYGGPNNMVGIKCEHYIYQNENLLGQKLNSKWSDFDKFSIRYYLTE